MASDTERKRARDALDRLAASLVHHRIRWAIVAIAAAGAAAWLGSRVSMRQNVDDFLPTGSAPHDTMPLPSGDADRIVVVLESPVPITAAEAGPILDTLASGMAAIPGVERVDYRLDGSMQHFLGIGMRSRLLLYFSADQLDSLATHLDLPYIRRALLGVPTPIPRSAFARAMGVEHTDPLGVIGPAVARLRTLIGAMPVKLVGNYFASPDQQDFFLSITPARRLAGVDSARRMERAVDSVLRTAARRPALVPLLRGKTLYAVGRPVALVRGIAIAVHDVQRVAVASTLIVFVLLVAFMRRIAAPLLMIGTVLYGVVFTSALAFVIYRSISLVSWLFIASLIGFGDEFALYIIAHYWLTAPQDDRAHALASAMRRPGPGILLGGLTSAGAFFSLIAISYPVMHQVAWLTTIGLLLILACSFTVLPLALAFTRPGRDRESGWSRWGAGVHRVGQRRPAVWLAGWVILLAGSGWLARGLHFDLHPWKLAVRGVPATAQLDQLSQRLGASVTPFTMVSRGTTAEAALAGERAALRELDRVQDEAGIAAVVALSRWLPPPAQQDADLAYLRAHRAAFDRDRFVRNMAAIVRQMPLPDSLLSTRYAPLVATYLDPDPAPISIATLDSAGMHDFVRQHLVWTGNEYEARSEVFLRQVPWADGVVDRFTGALGRDTSGALRRVSFEGDALRSATRVSVLRRDALAVIGLAVALTVGVLAARFRRVDLVLLCLLPLVCGVAAALAALALLHIELNMLTLAIAPLLIGLGSDDGIHIVDRLERRESAAAVLADVSAPMITTTLTTIAGFACLAFATFPGVRETGLIAALGLLVCLAASMQLVPMGYAVLRRR
jgi:predicted exporter